MIENAKIVDGAIVNDEYGLPKVREREMTMNMERALRRAIEAAKIELVREGVNLDCVQMTFDLAPEHYNNFRINADPKDVSIMKVLDRRRGQYETQYLGAIIDCNPDLPKLRRPYR